MGLWIQIQIQIQVRIRSSGRVSELSFHGSSMPRLSKTELNGSQAYYSTSSYFLSRSLQSIRDQPLMMVLSECYICANLILWDEKSFGTVFHRIIAVQSALCSETFGALQRKRRAEEVAILRMPRRLGLSRLSCGQLQ